MGSCMRRVPFHPEDGIGPKSITLTLEMAKYNSGVYNELLIVLSTALRRSVLGAQPESYFRHHYTLRSEEEEQSSLYIASCRGEPIMATMIKLRLPGPIGDLTSVQALPGLTDLTLDSKFGLVCISPRDFLYVVRTNDLVDNLNHRRELSPEIVEAYGDVRISSA
jgi:hypothetical protein